MGHKFSLVLSREITESESAILQDSGCAGAVFATDLHPTIGDVAVTKMDFDDTASPSLAEAIEAALEAVKTVPDLTVPSLMVPAQPSIRRTAGEEASAEEAPAQEPEAAASENAAAEPTVQKLASRKSARP